jgi:nitrogen regulatory protein PII-like uncharacterized protein
MALSDTVSELRGTGIATQNRVKLLLNRLAEENSEDRETLVKLLRDGSVTSVFITKVLRKEYGHDVVKDLSVASYRRTYLPQEVDGL